MDIMMIEERHVTAVLIMLIIFINFLSHSPSGKLPESIERKIAKIAENRRKRDGEII